MTKHRFRSSAAGLFFYSLDWLKHAVPGGPPTMLNEQQKATISLRHARCRPLLVDTAPPRSRAPAVKQTPQQVAAPMRRQRRPKRISWAVSMDALLSLWVTASSACCPGGGRGGTNSVNRPVPHHAETLTTLARPRPASSHQAPPGRDSRWNAWRDGRTNLRLLYLRKVALNLRFCEREHERGVPLPVADASRRSAAVGGRQQRHWLRQSTFNAAGASTRNRLCTMHDPHHEPSSFHLAICARRAAEPPQLAKRAGESLQTRTDLSPPRGCAEPRRGLSAPVVGGSPDRPVRRTRQPTARRTPACQQHKHHLSLSRARGVGAGARRGCVRRPGINVAVVRYHGEGCTCGLDIV